MIYVMVGIENSVQETKPRLQPTISFLLKKTKIAVHDHCARSFYFTRFSFPEYILKYSFFHKVIR